MSLALYACNTLFLQKYYSHAAEIKSVKFTQYNTDIKSLALCAFNMLFLQKQYSHAAELNGVKLTQYTQHISRAGRNHVITVRTSGIFWQEHLQTHCRMH